MTTTAPENLVYDRPEGFTDTPTHYCPGCTHGVAHRLIAERLEEMGVIEKTIGVAPVGCAVFAYNYFDTDFVEAPHGRAPAMATASSAFCLTAWCLLIKAMGIWLRLAWARLCTPPRAAKT